MASLHVTVEVERIERKVYNLCLSQEELDVLNFILRRVGGDPKRSYRGLCEAIQENIRLYAQPISGEVLDDNNKLQNRIYFKNFGEEKAND